MSDNTGTDNKTEVATNTSEKDNNVLNQFQAVQVNDKELLALEKKERSIALEVKMFDLEQRRAVALSQSAFFPKDLRGDVASAVIVHDLARRMDISEMEVAQSIYIIYNKPSFATTFLVARLNTSGLIVGSLKTVMNEDKTSCYCTAIEASTGDEITGITITLEMAQNEGWSTKSGSKWVTMPELMLEKRAQAFFIRGKYPQVMFGSQTKEELEDFGENVIEAEFTSGPESEIQRNNASVSVEIPAITTQTKQAEKDPTQASMFNSEGTTIDDQGNTISSTGEVIQEAADIPSAEKANW